MSLLSSLKKNKMNYYHLIKINVLQAGISEQLVKPAPQASHVGFCLCPGCSSFSSAPYKCTWENSREQTKCLGPCIHGKDPKEDSSCQLWTSSSCSSHSHVKSEAADGRSVCLYLSLPLKLKYNSNNDNNNTVYIMSGPLFSKGGESCPQQYSS